VLLSPASSLALPSDQAGLAGSGPARPPWAELDPTPKNKKIEK